MTAMKCFIDLGKGVHLCTFVAGLTTTTARELEELKKVEGNRLAIRVEMEAGVVLTALSRRSPEVPAYEITAEFGYPYKVLKVTGWVPKEEDSFPYCAAYLRQLLEGLGIEELPRRVLMSLDTADAVYSDEREFDERRAEEESFGDELDYQETEFEPV